MNNCLKRRKPTIEYILYDMSEANMIIYGPVPNYKSGKRKTDCEKQDTRNIDDPINIDKINQLGNN